MFPWDDVIMAQGDYTTDPTLLDQSIQKYFINAEWYQKI